MHWIRGAALAIMASTVLVTACKVGPNFEKPQVTSEEMWSQPAQAPLTTAEPDLHQWWKRFDDPILDQLITQAQDSNPNLEKALANVRVSLAVLGVNESQFWPSISVAAEYQRNLTNVAFLAAQGVDTKPYDVWAAGALMASWEIDVWGRVARLVESSKALLEADVEDLRSVLISIRSQVGTTYMTVRTLQMQLSILETAISNQKMTLDLAKLKSKAGTNTLLDVNQAQTNLDTTAAGVPQVVGQLDTAIYSLAQLCGTTPKPMKELLGKPAPLPDITEQIGVGIPAELLRRRPDVRGSELRVAAAVANIGANEALNLPIFSLSGTFYLASNNFSGLGNINNQAYGFGPTISWLIFQGGYVNSMIAQSKGKSQMALAGYRDTVLNAIRDTETCISLLVTSRESVKRYTTATQSAQSTYDLATLQYRAGTINLDRLMEIQNQLLKSQRTLADAQGSVAQNTVALYRALGGGWEDGAVNTDAIKAADLKESS